MFYFVSCKKESDPPIDTSNDEISITSVSPERGLQNGIMTDFTIKGNYTLTSHSSGTITIAFNNQDSPLTYRMFSDKNIIINKGSGEFEFNVETIVKDWGTEGAFSFSVGISPNPIPKISWTDYARDQYFFNVLP